MRKPASFVFFVLLFFGVLVAARTHKPYSIGAIAGLLLLGPGFALAIGGLRALRQRAPALLFVLAIALALNAVILTFNPLGHKWYAEGLVLLFLSNFVWWLSAVLAANGADRKAAT